MSLHPNKAVDIDNLAGKFLKDESDIIAEAILSLIFPQTSHNIPMLIRLLN